MDDIVKQALAKWPNVPDCYGWLGLDARGLWYMRDDRAQAAGAFASGLRGAKGSLLRHDKLIAFIERNYEADARGRWFFQNGPQRVYVELEAAPWVWRVADAPGWPLTSHTGLPATPKACLLDEHGRLFLLTERGLGLVHSLDMPLAADAVEAGAWVPESVRFAELEARGGHVLRPVAKGEVSSSEAMPAAPEPRSPPGNRSGP